MLERKTGWRLNDGEKEEILFQVREQASSTFDEDLSAANILALAEGFEKAATNKLGWWMAGGTPSSHRMRRRVHCHPKERHRKVGRGLKGKSRHQKGTSG